MIIEFSFKNFRSIKDTVVLSFEASSSEELEDYYVMEPLPGQRILKLGLIYGPNGTGKTNILEALHFLRQLAISPADNKTEPIPFSPFLFDEESAQSNTFFNITFIHKSVRYHYELELNRKVILEEKLYFYQPNKALVFHRKTQQDQRLSFLKFGSKFRISRRYIDQLEANTLANNTVIGSYLKTNFDSPDLKAVSEWFRETLVGMISPRTNLFMQVAQSLMEGKIEKESLVEIMSKADFHISDVLVKGSDIKEQSEKSGVSHVTIEGNTYSIKEQHVYFKHSFPAKESTHWKELSYTEESQGTKRYFQLGGLMSLMIQNRLIVPIDEIESSLHPDLLKHFLLTFLVNASHSQLIATTHHRELLIEKDILRKDVVWFTDLLDEGSTELFSLADFDTSVIRDTSSIYNAYKIGKLGAVPQVQDYYLAGD